MLFFYRLLLFQLFCTPVVLLSHVLTVLCSIHFHFYGLFLLAAVCNLRKFEAVCSLFLIGLWMDTPWVDIPLWGWSGFLLTCTVLFFKSTAWYNIFTARPQLWAGLLNLLLQCGFFLGLWLFYAFPPQSLLHYLPSLALSTVGVCVLIRPLLHWQEGYLA